MEDGPSAAKSRCGSNASEHRGEAGSSPKSQVTKTKKKIFGNEEKKHL